MTNPGEITIKEVLLELKSDISGMKEVLNDVRTDVTAIRADLENTSESVQDHETRLRAVERAMWKAAGASAVLGASGGYFATMFLP